MSVNAYLYKADVGLVFCLNIKLSVGSSRNKPWCWLTLGGTNGWYTNVHVLIWFCKNSNHHTNCVYIIINVSLGLFNQWSINWSSKEVGVTRWDVIWLLMGCLRERRFLLDRFCSFEQHCSAWTCNSVDSLVLIQLDLYNVSQLLT